MKVTRVVISCLLICALLFVSVPVHGESCYVALRELLSSKVQEELYLGDGVKLAQDKDKDKVILAVYSEKQEMFYLAGVNEYDQGEMTVWQDIGMIRGYHMIYSLCSIWNALQENMDKGYSITLAITEMDQVEGDWIIDDAESAASFITVMESTFASMTGS